MWSFNGVFDLVDVAQEKSNNRIVHIFKLILTNEKVEDFQYENNDLPNDDRVIPGYVQYEVYERNKSQCVKCGSKDHLYLDHIYLFEKDGTAKDKKHSTFMQKTQSKKKVTKLLDVTNFKDLKLIWYWLKYLAK